MRGHCIICDHPFSAAMDDISAIICGHTFHHRCLIIWIDNSKTCPRCRHALKAQGEIVKLSFIASWAATVEEDPRVQRSKIENLEAKVEQQTSTYLYMKKRFRDTENEQMEMAATVNSLRWRLIQIDEEEKKTIDQLTQYYKANQRLHEDAEKMHKITRDDLQDQLKKSQRALEHAEKQHQGTQNYFQDQLIKWQQAFKDAEQWNKNLWGDHQDQLKSFEDAEKQHKSTQDDLQDQLKTLQGALEEAENRTKLQESAQNYLQDQLKACEDAEKLHKSTRDDLQAQLKASQQVLELAKNQHKSAQNDLQNQLKASRQVFEDAKRQHKSTQVDVQDQLKASQRALELAEKQHKCTQDDHLKEKEKLLTGLADTKQVVLMQAEIIESLQKCIAGEGPRIFQEQLETESDFTARIKQLEYANRTLANRLQKYITNGAILNKSSTEANTSSKLHDGDQTKDSQLINCCNVLKSELLKTKELLQYEHDRNSNMLEALNVNDCDLDNTLPSAATDEASAKETTPLCPTSKKASTCKGKRRSSGPSRGNHLGSD